MRATPKIHSTLRILMPKVNGKKYPYTKAGMAAARAAKKKKKVTKKAGNARRRSM
tara:strand:+ start:188 stop:352 length:165 start_codon:yes stop_codon:yes gene_type:complete